MANNSSELTNRNITKMHGIELVLSLQKKNSRIERYPECFWAFGTLFYMVPNICFHGKPMTVQQKGNLRRRRRLLFKPRKLMHQTMALSLDFFFPLAKSNATALRLTLWEATGSPSFNMSWVGFSCLHHS